MSKQYQLVRNTFILFLGKTPQLVSLLLLPLYTTYLSKADYGTVDLVTIYAVLFISIITFQSEMASFRFLVDARDDADKRKKVISASVQIGIFALGLTVLAGLALRHFTELQHLSSTTIYMLASIISGLTLQIARGLGENTKFAIASLVAGMTTIILNVLLVIVYKLGVEGILISMIFANLFASIYLFVALGIHRDIDITSPGKKLRSEMIRYSLPLIPSSIFGWIIAVSDRTIIAMYLGLAASGIYAVSNKFSVMLAGVVYIYTLSWSESASKFINEPNKDFFNSTFDETLKIFGSIGLLMIAFLPIYFNILVSPGFKEAYLYIPILVTSVFVSAIIAYYSGIYIAKKMTGKIATTTAYAAIINLVMTLALIKYWGVYAAAIATLVSLLVLAVYRYFDIRKIIELKYNRDNLIMIVAMYCTTIFLCYYNGIFGNLINIAATTIFVILLNKKTLFATKTKLIDTFRPNRG